MSSKDKDQIHEHDATVNETVSNKDLDRFWTKVEKGDPGECWEWQAGTYHGGYGAFRYQGKKWRAHRFSVLIGGRDPAGKVVMHTCDNPACVNPSHLKVGTQRENMRDKVRKDRHNRGMRNGHSKLTPEKVRAIRASDRSSRELARRFGVSDGTIRTVRTKRTWTHVE